jgi:S1-C subfamily serine protease
MNISFKNCRRDAHFITKYLNCFVLAGHGRMRRFIQIFTVIILLCSVSKSFAQLISLSDWNEMMMRSTFKIQSGGLLGTCFIIVDPITNASNTGLAVLVTANHVLAEMAQTNATVFLRSFNGGKYSKKSFEFTITENGTNFWTKLPDADVAVMRINFPLGSDYGHIFASVDDLADDKFLADFKIHPGDEVSVLGYPYGFEANDSGFPVLRSGRIASFPLEPASTYPTFLLDFQVFRGNSGGPVYMCERRSLIAGDVSSVNVFKILGLVSQEASINEPISTLDEQSTKRHPLGIGVVVEAQKIREAINLLPPP